MSAAARAPFAVALFRCTGVSLVLLACMACGGARDPESPASITAPETSESLTSQAATSGTAPKLHAARARPRMSDGLLPGMMRRHPHAEGVIRSVTPSCRNPKLTYFGGPIIQDSQIVTVFWNSNVNASVQANIAQFYADVTVNSTYWPWLQEYDTVGVSGGTNQAILSGNSVGSYTITPSHCPASTTSTCHLTDDQLQTELNSQINGNVLPAPTLDCTGNSNTIYMVHFPANVSLAGPDGTGNSCSDYCAYHNTGIYGTNTPLIYAAIMDEFSGGCSSGCGDNSSGLDNTTLTASHELIEAVTDPDIGLDTQANYASPAGWGDNNNDCGEIADICDNGGTGDAITVGERTWMVQEVWSNKQGQCTSSGTPLDICSGTTTTNCRRCSCGDNGQSCSGDTSVCETSSSNVLFGACEECTSTENTCSGSSRQSSSAASDDICSTPDAGVPTDAGVSPTDAGVSPPDAGVSPPDAGVPTDAGLDQDAGTSTTDAGTNADDAGTTSDAGFEVTGLPSPTATGDGGCNCGSGGDSVSILGCLLAVGLIRRRRTLAT